MSPFSLRLSSPPLASSSVIAMTLSSNSESVMSCCSKYARLQIQSPTPYNYQGAIMEIQYNMNKKMKVNNLV